MIRSFAFLTAAMFAGNQASVFAQSVLNQTPSRVLGQPTLTIKSGSPNLPEGREFFNPYAVTVDKSTSPSPLFVSDYGNNRVLGWRDSTRFTNGAPADLVIGQIDKSTTLALGPSTSRTIGLSAPTGIAVDATGNLYVIDAGNNRILRFPKPFAQNVDIPIPDFVIGQNSFTTNTANLEGLSANSIALNSNGVSRADLTFDAQGNLWFSDALNNRVLRYPAASLLAGPNRPAADIALGQTSLTTNTLPTGLTRAQQVLSKSFLSIPGGITFDSDNRLYVADNLGRVLVYLPPYSTGKDAARIVGLQVQRPNTQPQREYLLASPQALFAVGARLGVVDPAQNRITLYDAFPSWDPESEEFPSPPAKVLIGQSDFNSFTANRSLAEPSETSLAQPFGAYYSGTELYVADTGNHRVLVYSQAVNNAAATRVLGQAAFNFNAANLVEGRELFLFSTFANTQNLTGAYSDGAGVAIDNRSATPHLYISDTFNNRVLGYRDARRVRPGDKADIVIGQNDLMRVLINAPSNNRESINDTGLFRPAGLAVDSAGDLYVADGGNGRVLRFPRPFDTPASGGRPRANLVIGQTDFFRRLTDASSRNMAYPFGVAFTVEGHLLVSDAIHSRVLFFRRPANGDFVNGQAAERVIGQPDFFTVGTTTADRSLDSPRNISTDTDDRLYVADAGNNRIAVYDRVTFVGSNAPPAFSLTGVSNPQGIFVSPLTGEIWVANSRGGRVTRFPRFERLALDQRSDFDIPSNLPLAVTQDTSGNLYVAEGINRVAIFYNALAFRIAGNYATRPLSPGTIAILAPAGAGVQFGSATSSFSALPLPNNLSDIQVLLNEQPVPLYFVSPLQINFLVPMNAPDSGTAEIQVIRQSTGQILAVSSPQFDRVSPALFVQGGALQGQVAALNEDSTINGPDNRIRKGRIIQLYGTGQGFVPNAPPDGTAPAGQTSTQERPRVVIGVEVVNDEDITYSGLAPGLPGVWQINVKVPDSVAPSAAVDVAVILRSVLSNRTGVNTVIRTTIAVQP